MKKIILFSVIAALTSLAGCQKKATVPALNNEVDTLSYELGLANTVGLQNYFMQAGIDSSNIKAFLKGFKEGANSGGDAEKQAYYAGIQAGLNVKSSMLPYVESQAFANDSTQHLSYKLFMRGFDYGVQNGAIFVTATDTLVEYGLSRDLEQRIQSLGEKNLIAQNAEAVKKAADFIAEKAKEEGVKQLPNGVLYKVLKEGNGVVPGEKDTVLVEYEGKLADGTVFDSNTANGKTGPATFMVRHTVPGFAEALKNMPVGSIWEVYIPYEQGYGARGQSSIPGFAPLTFKIQLDGVKKFVARPVDNKAKVQQLMEHHKQQ